MCRPLSLLVRCSAVWCVVESLSIPQLSSSFTSNCIAKRPTTVLQMKNGDEGVEDLQLYFDRRSFLKSSGACLSGVGSSLYIGDAHAEDSAADFDCLLDLPPITTDCVRLYLCRHGQTENNRLHLVQGARVDPPINDNGYEQSKRVGMAISRLASESNIQAAIPSVVAHSKLRRARETAEILTSVANQSRKTTNPELKLLGEIPALGEVDFGSLEGTDSNAAKRQMMSTFASWSIGDIDKRLAGGESGRDVLNRAVRALNELSKEAISSANNTPPSILAVSHSTYLRVLISMVNDSPLAQSAFMKINNGSINVVDVNVKGKTRVVNLNSGLFGGGRGLGLLLRGNSEDINVIMPEAFLIRRNEIRHLNGMNV